MTAAVPRTITGPLLVDDAALVVVAWEMTCETDATTRLAMSQRTAMIAGEVAEKTRGTATTGAMMLGMVTIAMSATATGITTATGAGKVAHVVGDLFVDRVMSRCQEEPGHRQATELRRMPGLQVMVSQNGKIS